MRTLGGKLLAGWCVVCVLVSLSCTPKEIASDITAQIFKGGAPSFEMESDVEVAETAGLTLIKMMEAFHHDNPTNKNYLVLLSRSYANYAFGFLEWKIMENRGKPEEQKYRVRAKNFYRRGKDYGLRILTRNKGFEKALTKDLDMFKKELSKMGRRYLHALFWTSLNWGSYINLSKDDPMAILEFPKVEAMMQRVLEIDEHFYFSTPHLFFGFSYGSRPPMFGGDSGRSKEHFEEALRAYDRQFLMGMVMYAQSYAVQNQDAALFASLLMEALTAPADALPEARLANELAKLRARWLLDHQNNYF